MSNIKALKRKGFNPTNFKNFLEENKQVYFDGSNCFSCPIAAFIQSLGGYAVIVYHEYMTTSKLSSSLWVTDPLPKWAAVVSRFSSITYNLRNLEKFGSHYSGQDLLEDLVFTSTTITVKKGVKYETNQTV